MERQREREREKKEAKKKVMNIKDDDSVLPSAYFHKKIITGLGAAQKGVLFARWQGGKKEHSCLCHKTCQR